MVVRTRERGANVDITKDVVCEGNTAVFPMAHRCGTTSLLSLLSGDELFRTESLEIREGDPPQMFQCPYCYYMFSVCVLRNKEDEVSHEDL